MTLLEYFRNSSNRWIPAKIVAITAGISKRELRDEIKAMNLFLVQSGSKAIVCSSNGSPNGYNFTADTKIIDRYRLQQRALAQGIHQNEKFAEIVLKRQRAKSLDLPLGLNL